MEQPTCKTCPFWAEDQKAVEWVIKGFCHALPPSNDTPHWPRASPDDWCGSHPAMTTKFIELRHKELVKEQDDLLYACT